MTWRDRFAELEKHRGAMIERWRVRDGYTSQQQCYLLLAVIGHQNTGLPLTPKQTLRKLCKDNLIDAKGMATRKGELLIRKWEKEDQKRRARG